MDIEELTLEAMGVILPNSSPETRRKFFDGYTEGDLYVCETCQYKEWDEVDKLKECKRCGMVMMFK